MTHIPGDYRRIERIGAGGMCERYLCEHAILKTQHAGSFWR